jgi:hypothetical protein
MKVEIKMKYQKHPVLVKGAIYQAKPTDGSFWDRYKKEIGFLSGSYVEYVGITHMNKPKFEFVTIDGKQRVFVETTENELRAFFGDD